MRIDAHGISQDFSKKKKKDGKAFSGPFSAVAFSIFPITAIT
jgi:hypothetical protein